MITWFWDFGRNSMKSYEIIRYGRWVEPPTKCGIHISTKHGSVWTLIYIYIHISLESSGRTCGYLRPWKTWCQVWFTIREATESCNVVQHSPKETQKECLISMASLNFAPDQNIILCSFLTRVGPLVASIFPWIQSAYVCFTRSEVRIWTTKVQKQLG